MRKKILLTGVMLAMLVAVVVGVLGKRQLDNQEVRMTGLAVWNLGPNTIVIRRVEVGDWTWGGSVESPPGFLIPVFRRFPALSEWWASTHREYTLGLPEKEYVSIDAQVLGPNPQVVLTALRLSVVTPDGVIAAGTGRWTIVNGQPADLHAIIAIPRGTEIHGLEANVNEQRVSFPVRR